MHDFYVDTASAVAHHRTVHARTEEFLYLLLWTCETLMRPTFRNLTDSFECWAYRSGWYRQLADLERRLYVESTPASRQTGKRATRLFRLTAAGRLRALGGRDPESCWTRAWDGMWRWVIYDLPAAEGTRRNQVRNSLRAQGFGWLQKSVWVSPHPLADQQVVWADGAVDVESLCCLEGRVCAGQTDEQIVTGAWDFEEINRRYGRLLAVLRSLPDRGTGMEAGAERLRKWMAVERATWLEAVSGDPLLPERLLPVGYLGREAWRARLATLRRAGELMRSYRLPLC